MVRSLLLALLGCAAVPAMAEDTLVAEDVPILLTDQSGTVTVPVAIHNLGKTPASIRLTVSDFEHQRPDGTPYPLGAVSAFAAASEADRAVLNGTSDLAPGATLTAKLTVSKLWEAGESDGVLKNGDHDLPTVSGAHRLMLRAVHVPQIMNVRIDTGGSGTPEIRFSQLGRGTGKVLVPLVNGDPMSYRFRWSLRLGDEVRTAAKPEIDLPANGRVFLDLSTTAPLPSGFLNWAALLISAGTLKDDLEPGDLILQPVLGNVPVAPLAAKVIPISARIRFWSDGFQELANLLCVFLLLTAGGITSIWVHCGMPNTRRGLDVQRRLNALTKQIDALGSDIPSQWRVLLAAEPKRLCASLYSMWWVFPAFAQVLDRLEKEVAMVEAWGETAYELSIIKRQTRQQLQEGIPPTVLAWIEECGERALAPIETGFTNDEELQGMRADVQRARQYLAQTAEGAQIPDLEKEIADREMRVQECLPEVAHTWPAEFGNLVEQVSNAIATPISPAVYVERDTLTLKVDLLNEFRQLRVRAMSAQPAAMAAGATGGVVDASSNYCALSRLESHRERLFAYLRPDAAESLRLARLFVAEMRQDIYEPVLRAEVEKTPPALSIAMEPPVADRDTPVHLVLHFHRSILNESAVCQEWTCLWDFGDGSQRETGWEVYHSFRCSGSYQIAVELFNLDGQPVSEAPLRRGAQVASDGDALSTSDRLLRIWRRIRPHAETLLEGSRLGLVLAIAVFGLVTTARQQASTLTFLEAVGAVFALGFGADTLKNLIMERS